MNESSTTEEPEEYLPDDWRSVLPEKVCSLRQKLCQKAKQQPSWASIPMTPTRTGLRMPCGESYVESRMRENRTYGSERGE